MKLKKAMACMLAGAMVLSMGAVLPAAASEDDNTLTVNMTRLRKKLEENGLTDFITTKKGSGYLIAD